MGKLCSVKSCPSGRKIKKGIDTSQPLSFFRPTTPAKLKKWNKALKTTMKTTDYICHLHFKEEDIKMYETFNIKGEITILPTGKKSLRVGALPTIEHQFISVPAHELQTNVVNNSQNVHSNEKQSKNKRDHQTQHQDQYEQQELLHDLPDNFILVIQQTKHDLDKTQLKQEAHDNTHNDMESDVTSLSAETFLENLKSSLLPQGWMYFEKPKGLEFWRINPTTMQILNRLRVNNDLSITVIFSTNEELNMNDNISSFNSINDYLKLVERWPICVGTEIDNNKFSKLCKGVLVGDDSYKRIQANPRCKSCRIIRHHSQKYNSTSTVLESGIAQKQSYSNLQKQCKRLKRMNMKLREKVYQIKAECSKKSEAAVKKAIMKLPKQFQPLVNSCFEAAKKKNCKGRRYTLEWIYECILIRIKSRKTYQFLRTRNILPLPCIETLNKFIRRISSSQQGRIWLCGGPGATKEGGALMIPNKN